jgi:hypothetical protein
MTRPHKRASPEVDDTSAIFKAKANDLKLRMDEVYTTSLLQLSFYSFYFSSSRLQSIHHGKPGSSQQGYVKQKLEKMRTKSDNGAAQERLSQVADHMGGASKASGKKGKSSLLEKNPDDVSIIRFTLRDEQSDQQKLFEVPT